MHSNAHFISRRRLLGAGLATATVAATTGCASPGGSSPKVVVIGGGYGGATAAKYLRKWSEGKVQVTMVDRNPSFISCPLSNLVLAGAKQMADITTGYDGLRKLSVKVVQDEVTAIDADKREVRLATYPGMIEYRGNNALTDVDARSMTAKLQLDDVKASVLNVVPPMRAGDIALKAGLVNANNRWCAVDWLNMESTA